MEEINPRILRDEKLFGEQLTPVMFRNLGSPSKVLLA